MHLLNYRPGRLGRNTILGTAGLGTRAVIQAAYLLIVSRWLGVEGYGLFAGSVALVILASPLANWGSGLLLTRHVSLNRNSSRAMWATALVQTGIIGSFLILAAMIISAFLQQRLPILPMLLLAMSELLLLPLAHSTTSHCYALERGAASAASMCAIPAGRVLTMLCMIILEFPGTPEHAALAHFAGSVAGLGVALLLVTSIDGAPAWRSRLPFGETFRKGTPYAVSSVAATSYQEIDKPLMLQSLGPAATGVYTIAFRVASIFVLPVSALINATLPHLISQKSGDNKRDTSRVMLMVASSYGLFAGMAMLLTAPLLPLVFGSAYEKATIYLSLLAPWPVLFATRQCLAARLTAFNRQRTRSMVETMGLAFVGLLNLALLPRMGESAAVISLLVTEVVVSLVFWKCSRK